MDTSDALRSAFGGRDPARAIAGMDPVTAGLTLNAVGQTISNAGVVPILTERVVPDPIFYSDPSVLIARQRYIDWLPQPDAPLAQQHNAAERLVLVNTIACAAVYRNPKILLAGAALSGLNALLYAWRARGQPVEAPTIQSTYGASSDVGSSVPERLQDKVVVSGRPAQTLLEAAVRPAYVPPPPLDSDSVSGFAGIRPMPYIAPLTERLVASY